MYGMDQSVPTVVGVQSGMWMPHGRKKDRNRLGASQASAPFAVPAIDGKNGSQMVLAAALKNLRRVVLFMVGLRSEWSSRRFAAPGAERFAVDDRAQGRSPAEGC